MEQAEQKTVITLTASFPCSCLALISLGWCLLTCFGLSGDQHLLIIKKKKDSKTLQVK